jgi:hypothetical protein
MTVVEGTLLFFIKGARAVQEGRVVEEGSHEELWSDASSVYHSLVALQEAATDRREQLSEANLEEIGLKQDAELAELEATGAKEAAQKACLSSKEELHVSDHPGRKPVFSGEKKSAWGTAETEEEELVGVVTI